MGGIAELSPAQKKKRRPVHLHSPPPCPWVFFEVLQFCFYIKNFCEVPGSRITGGCINIVRAGKCIPQGRKPAIYGDFGGADTSLPLQTSIDATGCPYWSSLVTSCSTLLAWASAAMPVWLRISYFDMFEVAAA
jgi:hypothetical protein